MTIKLKNVFKEQMQFRLKLIIASLLWLLFTISQWDVSNFNVDVFNWALAIMLTVLAFRFTVIELSYLENTQIREGAHYYEE